MSAAGDRPGEKIVLPGQTPEGQHILGVLVKRTYRIVSGKVCVRAEKDQKLVAADTPYDDPLTSSIRFESDFVPFKLATDVVLNGTVHALGGRPTQKLTASLQVASHRKDLLVLGDRVARRRDRGDPVFTDPLPFTTMPLRYELAYGGVDVWSDPKVPAVCPRNPLGRGFAVTAAAKAVDNLPLPNLEDPKDVFAPARLCCGQFAHWEKQPMPAGLGWYSKYWQPRAKLVGVMPADRAVEQELRKLYAQNVPADKRKQVEESSLPDMDFRFFNGASPGLVVPYLNGDEQVRTTHLAPEGELAFQLPGERPRIALDIGEGPQSPEVVLHTVMIRMDEREVDLVWRGAVSYPGPDWLPQMRKMELQIE